MGRGVHMRQDTALELFQIQLFQLLQVDVTSDRGSNLGDLGSVVGQIKLPGVSKVSLRDDQHFVTILKAIRSKHVPAQTSRSCNNKRLAIRSQKHLLNVLESASKGLDKVGVNMGGSNGGAGINHSGIHLNGTRNHQERAFGIIFAHRGKVLREREVVSKKEEKKKRKRKKNKKFKREEHWRESHSSGGLTYASSRTTGPKQYSINKEYVREGRREEKTKKSKGKAQ